MTGGSRPSASSCWTAWARRRCGTSSSPIVRDRCARGRSGPSSRGARSRCATTRGTSCPTARWAPCGCAAARARSATGSRWRRRSRDFWESGTSQAIWSGATPTAISPTAAGPTTCSRCRANGWRRRKSRTACYSTRRCRRSRLSASWGSTGSSSHTPSWSQGSGAKGWPKSCKHSCGAGSNRTNIRARWSFLRRCREPTSGRWIARGCVAGSSVPAALAAFLRRPLLELRDELLDLDPQSFQRREDLRLELALELLAFLQEVLHQVAEPVSELAPGGDGVDFGGFARLALLGQCVHTSLLFEGAPGDSKYTRQRGAGFEGGGARSETGTVFVFTTRLCVYASVRLVVRIGGRAAEGTRLESV